MHENKSSVLRMPDFRYSVGKQQSGISRQPRAGICRLAVLAVSMYSALSIPRSAAFQPVSGRPQVPEGAPALRASPFQGAQDSPLVNSYRAAAAQHEQLVSSSYGPPNVWDSPLVNSYRMADAQNAEIPGPIPDAFVPSIIAGPPSAIYSEHPILPDLVPRIQSLPNAAPGALTDKSRTIDRYNEIERRIRQQHRQWSSRLQHPAPGANSDSFLSDMIAKVSKWWFSLDDKFEAMVPVPRKQPGARPLPVEPTAVSAPYVSSSASGVGAVPVEETAAAATPDSSSDADPTTAAVTTGELTTAPASAASSAAEEPPVSTASSETTSGISGEVVAAAIGGPFLIVGGGFVAYSAYQTRTSRQMTRALSLADVSTRNEFDKVASRGGVGLDSDPGDSDPNYSDDDSQDYMEEDEGPDRYEVGTDSSLWAEQSDIVV